MARARDALTGVADQSPAFAAAGALAPDLKARIWGEVRFDAGSRALYATNSSDYRLVPIGVVIPGGIDDAVDAIAVCRRFGAHENANTPVRARSLDREER